MMRLKQIIPFKKELLFSTKISEVTSISLEHTISLQDDNVIKGDFIVTGDYKMTASSINREKFDFNIPVEVHLNDSYDSENVVIDIDNFYYEIVNDDSIRVNIDLFVDALKKDIVEPDKDLIVVDEEELSNNDQESLRDGILDEETDIDDSFNKDTDINNEENNDISDEEDILPSVSCKKTKSIAIDDIIEDNSIDDKVNIFNTDNLNADTYVTYYVYIVKEEDTMDKILEKFKISKEELSNYNDISDIKKGSKLIIPVNNE